MCVWRAVMTSGILALEKCHLTNPSITMSSEKIEFLNEGLLNFSYVGTHSCQPWNYLFHCIVVSFIVHPTISNIYVSQWSVHWRHVKQNCLTGALWNSKNGDSLVLSSLEEIYSYCAMHFIMFFTYTMYTGSTVQFDQKVICRLIFLLVFVRPWATLNFIVQRSKVTIGNIYKC